MIDLFLKINIGFLEFNLLDLLDIALVGLLIYQVYRLLRGSIAFNIFLGLLLIYVVYFVVQLLEMQLLETILGQFIEVGVIALLIVFQPEVRKFLLLLGKESRFKQGGVWNRLLSNRMSKNGAANERDVNEILSALENLKKSRTGAILVFSDSSRLQYYAQSGEQIDSSISGKLLESMFEKNSPLHDGAVIISGGKIIAAGCVLPVSENPEIPSRLGMRHKATVGITEQTDAVGVVVSEESGSLSYARNGRLIQDVTTEELKMLLTRFLESGAKSK